jgi:DNA-binding NtrC family response regulator
MEMQAKLLRALQEKEIRPVGSNDRIGVDSRVIAATNRDLETAYQAGTFRKDLYFRLNVVTIHLPSLRERRSDIPLLVHCFLERYAPEENIQVTQAAMKCMLQYEWPGNVRELENCIARALTLGGRETIDVSDLPPVIARVAAADEIGGAHAALTSTALADLERATIERVYEQARGDKSLAARMLGISRATIYRKLKHFGIAQKEVEVASDP